MTGILRSWRCLNGRCNRVFDAWEANPQCPACACVRVEWQPAGGHIGKAAKGADREVRALADLFGMTDMNSAERGRGAKKVKSAPTPASGGPVHTFAPGFSAVVDPGAGATCVPTSSKVDFKAKVGIGKTLAASKVFPSVRTNTAVEASHKQ